MTTPLIMLAIMVSPYLVARFLLRANQGAVQFAGACGIGALFCFTGVGHFIKTESMVLMLPDWMPIKSVLVYGSGVFEIFLGLLFFKASTRRSAGVIAVVLLIVLYPINVYASINEVPMGGHAWGWTYLLVRTPLQLAIIAWISWFVFKRTAIDRTSRQRSV